MSVEFTNPFTPNTAIQLADITELPAFEDLVAQVVDPTMNLAQKAAWDGRPNIRDLIRPPKFNGSITDIELTPFQEPYAKLQNARGEGWEFIGRPTPGSTTELDAQHRAEHCLGFRFVANARSSGRGIVGEIQAGLWYLPTIRRAGYRQAPTKHGGVSGGRTVMRVVTKPQLEKENFIRLHEESMRIALSALTDAARRTRRREREK